MTSYVDNCEQPSQAGGTKGTEVEGDNQTSHGISKDAAGDADKRLPPTVEHLTHPHYQSPLRQHHRSASQPRVVKETLNARSEYTNNEDDGKAEHHINQYIIKDEIGRGSFGAVHLAVDQYGKEYAVKEFSKSRLRKRAQSNILRRPHGINRPGQLAAGGGFNAPLHRHSAANTEGKEEQGNPLYLIKEEIAIMKKLNHPNLVSLIEVLDDPDEDSLYMLLEMCKKGVVMKVGLNEKADPYDAESCRCWFRDLILGIEYLHAQGVVHRDIKPDNLLLTEDDVLKIVDFGVSEIFEKESDMMTAKSAGSPAFLPPELCVTKHGDISGKAADIWSMGVSLYCLRYGKIPFERLSVLELYEAIKNDPVDFEADEDPHFIDLMKRILEKDPGKRITMEDLRAHPWVTKNGTDPLLSAEENVANLVEPPSEVEVNHAITAKMIHVLTLVKASKKFKRLLERKKLSSQSGNLSKSARSLLQLPDREGQVTHPLHNSTGFDVGDLKNTENTVAPEGVNQGVTQSSSNDSEIYGTRVGSDTMHKEKFQRQNTTDGKVRETDSGEGITHKRPDFHLHESSGEKGHAHDPLDGERLFLGIGTGDNDFLEPPAEEIVAESPTAADFSIYETAYQQEVDRIRASQGHRATIYLTRRVDSKKEYKSDKNMTVGLDAAETDGLPTDGWKDLLQHAREKGNETAEKEKKVGMAAMLSDIVTKASDNSKIMGNDLSAKLGLHKGP